MNTHADDTRRHPVRALPFAALALLGVVMVIVATRWGVGTSPDSASYISIARNVLSGEGYRDLYGSEAAIWPPFYPLLLSLIGLIGADPLVVARWFNALVFGANIVLVGLILRRYVRSSWVAVLGAFLAMTSIDLLNVHSMAWSEPLFLLLGVSGLCLIAAYLHNPSRALLFASAAAIALAAFTRYAGLALVAAGAVVVAFQPGRQFGRRLLDAVLFCLVACAPLGGWVLRNYLAAGSATARVIAVHFPSSSQIQRGLDTLSCWFLPDRLPLTAIHVPLGARLAVLAVVVAGLVVIGRIGMREQRRAEPAANSRALPKLPLVMAVFLVIYFALLLAHATLYDKHASFNLRILAPAYVPALIIVLCMLDDALCAARGKRALTTVAAILIAAYALWHANGALWWVNWRHQDGLEFTSTEWRQSELIRRIAELDPATPVYTNAADAVFFRTGRVTNQVPARILSATYAYRQNERLGEELAAMRERLEQGNGVIALFSSRKLRGRGYLVSREEIEAAMPLRVRTEAADGTIYELDR